MFSLKIGTENGVPISVKEGDRYKHIAVFGKPGAGKTALLSNFWFQDSIFKTGKVLIDPSGSFAKEAYSMSGGIYCSVDHPIGLNPLTEDYNPDDIADSVIEIINQVMKLATENVLLTARMTSAIREAVVWCVEHDQRRFDAVVDYLKTRCKVKDETKQGVIDRLNMFIQDKRFKNILCDAPPISWKDIIENQRTFILDCHRFSEAKMVFLGTIVAHGIKNYLRFSNINEYQPIALYVDECQNFINPNFFTILKEGRKYKISCILATQDITCIDRKLTDVIMSNIGTILSFKVGSKEAGAIAREHRTITAQEIQFSEKFHCSYVMPGGEGIAKTRRPPLVKKKSPPKQKIEKGGFSLEWFVLRRSPTSAE